MSRFYLPYVYIYTYIYIHIILQHKGVKFLHFMFLILPPFSYTIKWLSPTIKTIPQGNPCSLIGACWNNKSKALQLRFLLNFFVDVSKVMVFCKGFVPALGEAKYIAPVVDSSTILPSLFGCYL